MAMEGGSAGGSFSREYCLRWNNHQPNFVSFLSSLLSKESFADVTLVSAEGTRIQAHRIVLSACSPYFEGVFESNPCKHPVVILKDVQYVDLRAIITFIYNGEVNIRVDRINEIIQTAVTLQIKGLADVPSEDFKRVHPIGRCVSPAENSSSPARTQPPPPLIMPTSAAQPWPSTSAETSENMNDFPVRKKLKKSASANIPFSSGSSSTNGDVTNSTGSSFESGMGTSVSRSVDEGIGSDISSNDQPQSTVRPGPPPLTAANALIPKSRSLDDGYQRNKNSDNAEAGMEPGGYSEQHGLDDNGLGQDGGFDDLEADGHPKGYFDEGDEDEQAEMYYDDDPNQEQYDGAEVFNQAGNNLKLERALASYRKPLPKTKINKNNNNNNSRVAGVGHSLTLYRQQQPLKNFASRAHIGIGKRRRGRPLLRQPRINKRLDHESSPGGGRDDGGGYDEQGYSSDTGAGEPYTITRTSSACYEPQQQQHHHHQARSASVEHEIYSTTVATSSHSHSPSPSPQIKPTVPIVRVSQCSPTPPTSPQHVPSPKPEPVSNQEHLVSVGSPHSHPHVLLHHQSSLSGSPVHTPSTSTTLLTVPTVGEPVSPSISVRLAGSHQQGHLVKQVSQPLLPSHHYHSSEDESGPSSSSAANPVIRRQHSQPVQSSTRSYPPSYSIVGRGQLFHILKSDQFAKDEESAAYLVETPIQLVPASESGSGGSITSLKKESTPSTHSQGEGSSVSITLKEVGQSRSLTLEAERPPHTQAPSLKDSSSVSMDSSSFSSLHSSEGQIHRSVHCPALRPGPALGCNFCWNSVDSCGRVLRRKTKYFCPECHINLCIVPCFQDYHEKSDRKKKLRTKPGLPKPSSM